MTSQKLNALIIDPDARSRARLKQAALSVGKFGEVHAYMRIEDGRTALFAGARNWDVIFLSSHFDKADVASFIADGKKSQYGQDSAYVMVMKGSDQDSASVAAHVMFGSDGLLLEPYSLDALTGIIQLAAQVKNDRRLDREKVAYQMMLTDLVREIDQLAYMLYCKINIQPRMAKLKERTSVLKTLSSQSLEVFVESALDTFENAEMPIPRLQKEMAYNGASMAVRRRLAKRLDEASERRALILRKNV